MTMAIQIGDIMADKKDQVGKGTPTDTKKEGAKAPAKKVADDKVAKDTAKRVDAKVAKTDVKKVAEPKVGAKVATKAIDSKAIDKTKVDAKKVDPKKADVGKATTKVVAKDTAKKIDTKVAKTDVKKVVEPKASVKVVPKPAVDGKAKVVASVDVKKPTVAVASAKATDKAKIDTKGAKETIKKVAETAKANEARVALESSNAKKALDAKVASKKPIDDVKKEPSKIAAVAVDKAKPEVKKVADVKPNVASTVATPIVAKKPVEAVAPKAAPIADKKAPIPEKPAAVIEKKVATPEKVPTTKEKRGRLKRRYIKEILPALKKELGYKNMYQVPRLNKIVVNMRLGDIKDNSKSVQNTINDLSNIAGQKAIPAKAKKSVSNFKVRENQIIGAKVTLRGERMYEFFDKLTSVVLPRVRDFHGVSDKSFDGRGNYAMGIKEHIIFPEISYELVEKVRGMDIVIVTTAGNDNDARLFLRKMGMPFKK